METNQLEPEIVNLAKAIRQVESQGNFQSRGASGEYGAYQYMPDTWKGWSVKYLGKDVPLEKATKEQQNEVAYKQIKEWKDAGHNVGEIASLWNSGNAQKYLQGWKGEVTLKNGRKVSYDTPAYAENVAKTYQEFKKQSQTPTPVAGDNQAGGIAGLVNKVTAPFVDLAAMPVQAGVKAYNALTGSNVQDPYAQGVPAFGGAKSKVSDITDIKGKGKSALGVAETTAAAATGGTLLKLALGSGSFATPAITNLVKSKLGKTAAQEFAGGNNQLKLKILEETMGKAGLAEKEVIKQMIDKILPTAIKEAGGKVPFLELYPRIAKIGGITKNIIKWGIPTAIGGGLIGAALSSKK